MKRLQRSRFTIMELMGVLIIMGLMMGLVVNTDILKSSAGVNVGVQKLSSQMRLARQYAITHRKRVAILLPEPTLNQTWDSSSNDFSDLTFRAKSFRACLVDDSDAFGGFIDNTSWGYLPTGTVLFEDTASAPTVTGVEFQKASPADSPETHDVRAVIFKPDGTLKDSSSNIQITVAQGVVLGTDINKSLNANDEIVCTVNWLTGAITFRKD